MLRHIILAINHLVEYIVIQFMQGLCNNSKCVSFVMAAEVFHILEKKSLRPFFLQNTANVKEKCSLCLILESGCSAQTLFFGNSGNRERLAWKPRDKYIMIRNGRGINLCNVAIWLLTKIGKICLLTVLVPFVGVDAMPPCSFKCDTHSANPCEKIYKRERSIFRNGLLSLSAEELNNSR